MALHVVGHDGTDRGDDAVALARRLSALYHAQLLAVHVIGMPPIRDRFNGPALDRLEEAAGVVLARTRRGLGDIPGPAPRVVHASSPAAGLQAVCEAEGAGLVTVGPSHRGPVGRLLAGTTAERLLSGAPCPVALAPRGYAEDGRPVRARRRRLRRRPGVGLALEGRRGARVARRRRAARRRGGRAGLGLDPDVSDRRGHRAVGARAGGAARRRRRGAGHRGRRRSSATSLQDEPGCRARVRRTGRRAISSSSDRAGTGRCEASWSGPSVTISRTARPAPCSSCRAASRPAGPARYWQPRPRGAERPTGPDRRATPLSGPGEDHRPSRNGGYSSRMSATYAATRSDHRAMPTRRSNTSRG